MTCAHVVVHAPCYTPDIVCHTFQYHDRQHNLCVQTRPQVSFSTCVPRRHLCDNHSYLCTAKSNCDTHVSHAFKTRTPKTTCDTQAPTSVCLTKLDIKVSMRRSITLLHGKDFAHQCEDHTHQRAAKTTCDAHQCMAKTIRDTHLPRASQTNAPNTMVGHSCLYTPLYHYKCQRCIHVRGIHTHTHTPAHCKDHS